MMMVGPVPAMPPSAWPPPMTATTSSPSLACSIMSSTTALSTSERCGTLPSMMGVQMVANWPISPARRGSSHITTAGASAAPRAASAGSRAVEIVVAGGADRTSAAIAASMGVLYHAPRAMRPRLWGQSLRQSLAQPVRHSVRRQGRADPVRSYAACGVWSCSPTRPSHGLMAGSGTKPVVAVPVTSHPIWSSTRSS